MDLRLPAGSRSSDADQSEIDGGIPLDEDHSNLSCKEASIKAKSEDRFWCLRLHGLRQVSANARIRMAELKTTALLE